MLNIQSEEAEAEDQSESEEESQSDEPALDPAIENAVLPPEYVLQLQKRITKVVGMWAEEERMQGANVYCKCAAG